MEVTDFTTEDLVLNMGPQHPSTHGVLRLVLTLDGELIIECDPVIGYLHSSMEKICENRTYVQIVPFTDRFDYLGSLINNFVYVRGVEGMLGVEVPRRCEYIRVLMSEMQRLQSHLLWLGTFGLDLGAITLFLYCFREREVVLDLLESVTGQRLLYNYMRIGGLRNDLPVGFGEKCRDFLNILPERMGEYDQIFTNNRIFQGRVDGVGFLSKDEAVDYAISGPMARASGIDWDIRRDDPYSVYPELEFDVPVEQEGDCLARYRVRMEEMRQSRKLALHCLDALDGMKGEDFQTKVPKTIRPPEGESYTHVESPRGELGCYLISDGSPKPPRMHWRAPSFANLQAIPVMSRGGLVADLVAVLGSIDIVLGDIDR
ncbi:MAG TPA: NADH-quinone oxidoreductase subunit D [Armatimonadota bacterium]|nr:NADH-quinone oxidoreductase subunit D [Armatimonadota bacterium]